MKNERSYLLRTIPTCRFRSALLTNFQTIMDAFNKRELTLLICAANRQIKWFDATIENFEANDDKSGVRSATDSRSELLEVLEKAKKIRNI